MATPDDVDAIPAVTPGSAMPAAPRVALLGFGPLSPALVGADAVVSPEPSGIVELHEVLEGQVTQGRTVLALYPEWGDPELQHRLRTVRSALETLDVVPVPMSLPPLAAMVVAGLLATMAPSLDASTSLALLDRLNRVTLTRGWLGSVAGLSHLPVPMRLHARSLLPGGAFVVTDGNRSRVTKADRRTPRLPMPDPNPAGAVVVAVGGSGDAAAVQEALDAAGWSDATQVDTTPLSDAWWGTDRYVEVVVHPVAQGLTALNDGLVAGAHCRWCGRPSSTAPCIHCHHASPTGAQL